MFGCRKCEQASDATPIEDEDDCFLAASAIRFFFLLFSRRFCTKTTDRLTFKNSWIRSRSS